MEFNDLYSTPLPKAERERHKQAHFNLSKGTFEIGNTQIGIDVPEEIKAKNTPSKSKLSIESKEVYVKISLYSYRLLTMSQKRGLEKHASRISVH